ncbi:hypothetical protein ACHQM5_030256 [Ranunculus cassubicifolius]
MNNFVNLSLTILLFALFSTNVFSDSGSTVVNGDWQPDGQQFIPMPPMGQMTGYNGIEGKDIYQTQKARVFRTCGTCRCCQSGGQCENMKCCHRINCNIPGKAFGTCVMQAFACNCDSCTM